MNSILRKIRSLQSIVYTSLLILIILTIGTIGIPMINLTRKQICTLANEQTNKVLDHLELSINLTMERMTRLSNQLTMHNRLQEYLLSSGRPLKNSGENGTTIENRFRELVQMYDDVVSIFVFGYQDANGSRKILSSRRYLILNEELPLEQQIWFSRAEDKKGAIAITPPHLQNFIKRNYIWVVSFSRRIKNTATGDPLGILLIDTNIDIIKDICTKNTTDIYYYYIIDRDGNFIFHPHEQLINSGLFIEETDMILSNNTTFRIKDGKTTRLYTVRTLDRIGWKLVAVTNMRALFAPFSPPLTFLLIWISLSLIFLLFMSRIFALRVLAPINRLRDSMKQVEEGRFDISVKVSDYPEVKALAKDFNIMIRKIGDLIELNEKEHTKLRLSDFNALQSQINPHFLYNTLDSVIWMTAKGNSTDVITMVSSLSKLLRRSLATGDSLVPLEEEYDHARQYCIIQKIRYKDQLEINMDLPMDCRDIGVPRLILQPLIENTLYHGIEDWDDGLIISITSERYSDWLSITVSDNGKGAEPAHLEAILNAEKKTSPQSSVGLKNINDRLQLLFGEKAGMKFQHQFQGGLDVILTIPI